MSLRAPELPHRFAGDDAVAQALGAALLYKQQAEETPNGFTTEAGVAQKLPKEGGMGAPGNFDELAYDPRGPVPKWAGHFFNGRYGSGSGEGRPVSPQEAA